VVIDAFGDLGGDFVVCSSPREPGNSRFRNKRRPALAQWGIDKHRHTQPQTEANPYRRIWRIRSSITIIVMGELSFSFPMIRFLVFGLPIHFCCSYNVSKTDNRPDRGFRLTRPAIAFGHRTASVDGAIHFGARGVSRSEPHYDTDSDSLTLTEEGPEHDVDGMARWRVGAALL